MEAALTSGAKPPGPARRTMTRRHGKEVMLDRLRKKIVRRVRMPQVLATASVEVAGRRFLAPVVDGDFCDVSEPWQVDLLARLLPQRAGTFIDVGMNIGQTLLGVKAVDPGRAYVGFEPNSRCFTYCERLVARNALTCVKLVPAGLSSHTGLARLQLYSANETDEAASIMPGFRPAEPVTSEKIVPVFAYDDIAPGLAIGAVGFVKIDVEGAELDVLAAMKSALAADRPWILIEILPCYTKVQCHGADC